MSRDLDDAAAEMGDANQHLRRVLLLAAAYVEDRAREGDPEAVELAQLLDGAWDRFRLAGSRPDRNDHREGEEKWMTPPSWPAA